MSLVLPVLDRLQAKGFAIANEPVIDVSFEGDKLILIKFPCMSLHKVPGCWVLMDGDKPLAVF